MRLYLVQHGAALAKDVDPARPLSEQGEQDVRRIAAFLARAGVGVGRIWHSGKRRAEQTAEQLAAALPPHPKPEARAGMDPDDPTDTLAYDVTGWDRDTMICGHLPFMARLSARLLTGREDGAAIGFTPGTVACLERTGERQFALRWMISPDLLRGNA